jgi:hypothetical protein
MKRLVFVACASLAVLMSPCRADAQRAHADSPKTTLPVTRTLTVGTTMLKPGDYRFQCRTIDGRTFLVVTSVDTGKEIARVRCVEETLADPVTDSDYRTVAGENGTRTLISVRIKGEAVAHRVVD